MKPISVRVPATTANLGPGFDSLGVALSLYNTVTLGPATEAPSDPFLNEAAGLFFKMSGKKPFPFSCNIAGEVPRSRGLGSSVTVRLGLLTALNLRSGQPLKPSKILDMVIALEGHPDNAVPAALGGFCACGPSGHVRSKVSSDLHFIAAIPDSEMETKKARGVLPLNVERLDAVINVQNTAVIVGAFFSRDYKKLHGAFGDRLHQPFRQKLLPGFAETLEAAEKHGALGAFLSGSGSTVLAVSLDKPKAIAKAMKEALLAAGHKTVITHLLKADNQGVR